MKPSSPPIHAALKALGPSVTLASSERSGALQAAGRQIYDFGLGQSPFPVPDSLVRALQKHAHQRDYLPVQGLPALRTEIAAWHARRGDPARAAEDVVIGPGSKELLFLTQLVHRGTLTLPSPSWVSYRPQAQILGKAVEWIEGHRRGGWRLSADELQRRCEESPGTERLLILNYPNNPTGLSYQAEQLEALAEVARRHRIIIISDEIYGELEHRGAHRSIASFYPEGTIISSGLSKWCGAGGWRLGYFIFPPELHRLREALCAVASESFSAVSAPIQWAAREAFTESEELERYRRGSRLILRGLGGALAALFRGAGIFAPEPEGGFYLFLDFTAHAERLKARGVSDGEALAERLLEEAGVITLAGIHFGRPREELSLRLSYVNFDGGALLDRLAGRSEDALPLALLKSACPLSFQGAEAILRWLL